MKKFDEDPELEILNGRYGPYITYKKANYRIPKTVTQPEKLTYEECMKIITEAAEPRCPVTTCLILRLWRHFQIIPDGIV